VGTEKQLVPHPAIVARNSDVVSGWDPFEVWRTRVLLPRLADEALDRLSVPAPVAAVRVVVGAISANGESSNTGDSKPIETSAGMDTALRHELINVLGSLCLVGLTSILLHDSHRHPPRRTRLPSPAARP
jgi:hypothetical protein